MPDQQDRDHQQRGRDRPQDEGAGRVHRADLGYGLLVFAGGFGVGFVT